LRGIGSYSPPYTQQKQRLFEHNTVQNCSQRIGTGRGWPRPPGGPTLPYLPVFPAQKAVAAAVWRAADRRFDRAAIGREQACRHASRRSSL
jgi:hypothetical protein